MAKKYGFDPFILLTMETPQPTTVVGGGSGQGGHSPFPMSFAAWSESPFVDDYDLDGDEGTEEDFFFPVHHIPFSCQIMWTGPFDTLGIMPCKSHTP